MSSTNAHHRTKEGFSYFPTRDGLQQGFVTEGAIEPKQSFAGKKNLAQFDTIVIGAGYAGLTAARDLTLAGQSVLLVEARDRIGGRTWTAQRDGEKYEMGGTWVHWQQGFVWRELVRYGFDRRLKITPNEDFPDYAVNRTIYDGKIYSEPYSTNFPMLDDAFRRLVDVDGVRGVTVNAIPTQVIEGQFVDEELVNRYDKLSVADRVAECRKKNILSERELAYLVPWVELSFGAKLADCSFLELIKWFQHGNQSFFFLGSTLWFYKLMDGQSHLARSIFDEAISTGNLCYSFETVVSKVTDRHGHVEVATSKGSFKASKVVCTLPINVANKVQFEPELSPLRREAFAAGHVNFGHKIHSEVAKPEMRSITLNGFDSRNPMPLEAGFGDQTLKNGNVAVVAFGAANKGEDAAPQRDPTQIKKWLGRLHPELEENYVGSLWMPWSVDPYANGTWAMFPPEYYTKYFKELQKPHGNVLWASADSADGWKSFIDGAIEQGMKAAYSIEKEWRKRPQPARL
ncbi:hypothetical protein JCM6882_003039 [Rhodosporidiobolus microsporus]